MVKNNAKLASEGKIIARNDVFCQKIQIYTLAIDDGDLMAEKIKNIPFQEIAQDDRGIYVIARQCAHCRGNPLRRAPKGFSLRRSWHQCAHW